jgi:hypothetical protein
MLLQQSKLQFRRWETLFAYENNFDHFAFYFLYSILFLRIGCCKLRVNILKAGPTGRAVKGVGRSAATLLLCCGFASRRVCGCLCISNVVCCQVEVLQRADHSSRVVLPTVMRHSL